MVKEELGFGPTVMVITNKTHGEEKKGGGFVQPPAFLQGRF